MRTLDQILQDINDRIADSLAYSDVQYWNQAYLQPQDEKTFPIVNNGNKNGYKISVTDYALQCYHRVVESKTETDYTKGYGKYPYQYRVYTIRNIWLGTIGKIPATTYESTDDVKSDVYASFPVILTDKEIVKTTNENIDKLAILNEEFDGNTFSNLSLEMIAFYIEYEVRQKIRCA